MTPDAREQARHISEVTKAYAEGKEIEFRDKAQPLSWKETPRPLWDWDQNDYRVKPEERKHEKLAELLKRIGWKDTGDAQWENLEKAMPGIRWLLAPDDEERKPREWRVWTDSSGICLRNLHPFENDRVAVANGWSELFVREVLPETETE